MKLVQKNLVAITDVGVGQEQFDAVIKEADKQIAKWGVQTHTPFEWAVFTGEECGELQKAIADHYYGRTKGIQDVIEEAIQTATLCLKIAKMYADCEDFDREAI